MNKSTQIQVPYWKNSHVINSEWIKEGIFMSSYLTENAAFYIQKTQDEFQGFCVLTDWPWAMSLLNLSGLLFPYLQHGDDTANPVYLTGSLEDLGGKQALYK